MSELDDSFAKLIGRQPNDTERQSLYRVRDALGLKNNDALWLVLMALESYDEKYKAVPAQIEKAAKFAAANAATQAQEQINTAIAALVPTVQSAVQQAAAGAVQRIQLGRSFLSLWAGTLMIGGAGLVGWLMGARIFESAAAHSITWSQFWSLTGWGIGIGAAIPGLLALSFLGDDAPKGWQWGTFVLALVGAILLGVKWWSGF